MKQWFVCSKFFLIISVTFLFHTAFAQRQQLYSRTRRNSAYVEKPVHITFSFLGPGMMCTQNHPDKVNISFPYQTRDLNGNKTQHTFTGSSDNLLSKQSFQLGVISLDVGTPSYTLSFSLSANTMYGGAYYSIGYGRNIYLGGRNSYIHTQKGKRTFQEIQQCGWLLRPSMNISSFSFSGGVLGNIDNNGTYIDLLDQHADPEFTKHPGKGVPYTVQADRLEISYKQNQIGLMPKLALCSNPYKKTFSMQLFVSYFIPLSQHAGLTLRQYNKDESETNLVAGSGQIKFTNHHDITATYNNHTFQTVPFHANNIYIGMIFGFNLLK